MATRLTITERALVQRINRSLSAESQQLKKARTEQARNEVGEFFVVDSTRNQIVKTFVDLGKFGRELGALKEYEELEK